VGSFESDVDKWFDEGVASGSEWMLVVHAGFERDPEDARFPAYVEPGEDPNAKYNELEHGDPLLPKGITATAM